MTDTDFDVNEMEDEEFEINDWENKPQKNIIEKGRYIGEVKDIVSHVSSSGNNCAKIVMVVEGKYIYDFPIRSDSAGNKHKMSYKWHNFLYSIGIRDVNSQFRIKRSQLVGKKCLVDVSVNKEGTDNQINGYSPIEEELAPLTDIPAENNQVESKKEEVNLDDL